MDSNVSWLSFTPDGLSKVDHALLEDCARDLGSIVAAAAEDQRGIEIERLRHRVTLKFDRVRRKTGQRLVAAIHILCDLGKQGWVVSVKPDGIHLGRPSTFDNPELDRARIRRQLHAERDEQLREPSVRAFVQSMESRQLFQKKIVNVFSVMADGRELAGRLRSESKGIEPYLQFIRGEERCTYTGLRLIDIWRYFRHTWSTPYRSVPGRTMMILVRDAAGPCHPVIGIAALSSATVGLTVRDERIGWTYRALSERIRVEAPGKYLKWMHRTLQTAVEELYKVDLLAERVLSKKALADPTEDLIAHLLEESRNHRKQHYRFMQQNDYKDNTDVLSAPDEYWEKRAKSLLFRSKRENELAALLAVKRSLNKLGETPTKETFVEFIQSGDGRVALTKLIRKAKADRVGTAIADLTVCGAVPPYNEVLGGKLVASLMASPEVAKEYKRRYGKAPSIIAIIDGRESRRSTCRSRIHLYDVTLRPPAEPIRPAEHSSSR